MANPSALFFPDQFPELVTERLRLRELRPGDTEAIFRIFSDPEVIRYYDFEAFQSQSEAADLIARQRLRFKEQEAIRWGITQTANDVVIGTIGLHISTFNAQGGLGYDLARPYWRRGVMSEALTIVIRFGFNTLRLNRLQALVVPGNDASAGLLRKLGFSEEGLLRDYAFFKGRYQDLRCFSLLKREYRSE